MILTSKSQFQQCLEITDDKQYIAHYNGLVLSSVFQPIFNIARQVVGLEALVRIREKNGESIRPDLFFGTNLYSDVDKLNVERLSRIIHLRNFSRSALRDKQLFLNVLPIAGERLSLEDLKNGLLAQRIKALNLDNKQIVMELIELDCENQEYLELAMLRLRENGFSVAIDDFGVSASTKERVLQIQPQILKLDRSILLKYLDGDQAPLLKSIQLAKSVGAQVVVEGIETEHQYDLMCQLEIDMYQGFFLALPEPLSCVYEFPIS